MAKSDRSQKYLRTKLPKAFPPELLRPLRPRPALPLAQMLDGGRWEAELDSKILALIKFYDEHGHHDSFARACIKAVLDLLPGFRQQAHRRGRPRNATQERTDLDVALYKVVEALKLEHKRRTRHALSDELALQMIKQNPIKHPKFKTLALKTLRDRLKKHKRLERLLAQNRSRLQELLEPPHDPLNSAYKKRSK